MAAAGLAAAEPWPYGIYTSTAVLGTVLVALFVDGFGGIVVGLAGAAAVIAAKQAGGVWTADGFPVALGSAVALVAAAWLSGMVSSDLHGRTGRTGHDLGAITPAYGSLGLLGYDAALARLDDEVARAGAHYRALTVAVVQVRLVDPTLDDSAKVSAERAVARLMETLVRETDVPFAVNSNLVGVILPESDRAEAWEILGRVLDAATTAAFTVRERGERLKLADCAELNAGIVALSRRINTAEKLVEAARRSSDFEAAAA